MGKQFIKVNNVFTTICDFDAKIENILHIEFAQ